MMRLTAIFIAVCMVVIAGSTGAAAYLMLGVSRAEAAIVGIAVLTALALYNTISSRLRDRSDISNQIANLSRGTGDLAHQVAELGRRLLVVETKAAAAADKARASSEPLAAEIGELGALVKRVAQSVAAHEQLLSGKRTLSASDMRLDTAEVATESAETSDRAEIGEPDAAPADVPSGRFKGMERRAIVDFVRASVEGNRIDLYLQPIVTLPQRKVRYYEALSRLKAENGEVVPAQEFLEFAESGGLLPKLDNFLVFRCVQVVRRLLLKNRDIGLFCNIAGATLAGAEFPQLLEFMDANRALGPSLVFEFTQAAFRAMGPVEHEALAALAERGFRFSLDNMTDLRIEPRGLSERGFRFIKVPSALLLSRANVAGSDIHPADLSDLVGRFGIDLIAEKIESESAVVDLLDYDVRFGQGFLFSPPRPVRAEALQGVTERSETAMREAASPETAPRPPGPEVRDKSAAAGERPGSLAQLARGLVGRA
jgi:cyclic-di-GMP phosphodiesterase, flagellum assembly factor TipF